MENLENKPVGMWMSQERGCGRMYSYSIDPNEKTLTKLIRAIVTRPFGPYLIRLDTRKTIDPNRKVTPKALNIRKYSSPA